PCPCRNPQPLRWRRLEALPAFPAGESEVVGEFLDCGFLPLFHQSRARQQAEQFGAACGPPRPLAVVIAGDDVRRL
ncbi:MAG TPA: hypothetical protein VGV18_04160, partial [Verrucomicrobiae bacterium]|nr:hypothetical protein [Verrucomicrobiae bacterium]